MNFKDSDFRSSGLMRLKVLQDHIDSGRLNEKLEWKQI
jgi:UDP-glucose 4-epimerase